MDAAFVNPMWRGKKRLFWGEGWGGGLYVMTTSSFGLWMQNTRDRKQLSVVLVSHVT